VLSCWYLPRLFSQVHTFKFFGLLLLAQSLDTPLNPPRVVLSLPSGLWLVIPSHWALTHARWHLLLTNYTFHIHYRPGKQSGKPDALSRRPDHLDIAPEPQVMLPKDIFASITTEPEITLQGCIEKLLDHDESLEEILNYLQNGSNTPTYCCKLHQDPWFNLDFLPLVPKPICAGFRSCDPGTYPCRVATLVSTKTPMFSLSISYRSPSVIAQLLLSCRFIVPHTFLHIMLLWSDFCIVRFP
jgi:hypothetical protein